MPFYKQSGSALLRKKLTAHNRHVLLGTLVALLATILFWTILYFVGQWLVLFGLTAAVGDAAHVPADYDRWFVGYAVGICTLGLFWRAWKRHQPLRDRPIFGAHLIPEFLFLPADLTFSVSGNLTAWRRITPALLQACGVLLEELQLRKRVDASRVGQLGLGEALSDEALLTLQYAGLIDLHRGESDWFYTIRSSRASEVAACLGQGER